MGESKTRRPVFMASKEPKVESALRYIHTALRYKLNLSC